MKTIFITLFIFNYLLIADDVNTTTVSKYIDKFTDTTKTIINTTANEIKDFKEASTKEMYELSKETTKVTNDVIQESKSVKILDENSSIIPSKENIKSLYKVSKSKINDLLLLTTLKHALYINKKINSTIYININNAHVELFGRVKSKEEEQEAVHVALTIKGILSVESALLIDE